MPIERMRINGGHSQDTRSGRNLYDIKNVGDRTIPTEISIDDDDWITVTADNSSGTSAKYVNYFTKNLNLKPNTQYSLIAEFKKCTGDDSVILNLVNNGNNEGQFNNEQKLYISSIKENKAQKSKFIITTKTDLSNTKNGLRTYLFMPAKTSVIITFRISVIENTSIGLDNFEYEKYGASPTTDYPSEIKTVKNNVEVRICNKNFIKMSESQKIKSNGITATKIKNGWKIQGTSTTFVGLNLGDAITKAGTYTFSSNFDKNSTGVYVRLRDKTTNSIVAEIGNNQITFRTYTIKSNVNANLIINIPSATTVDIQVTETQFEKNTAVTSFVGHEEQTATVQIQQEMLEGDYIKDVEHQEWGKLILTGNDFDYAMQQNGKGLNYFYFGQPLTKMRGRIISNMLKYNANMWTTTQYMDYVNISGSQHIINIMLSDTTITTVAQFKAKLQELYNAGTPLILYYELAEPLDLELTEEQKVAMNKINNMSTYKNITNITIDDDLASVDVIYKKDLESEHNGFGKEISALITTVGNLLSEINDKVSKVAGKGLSQNDFTDEYKAKLDNLNETIPKIVDNLATEDSSKSLSAKQGKVLNEKIMGTVLYVNETGTGGDMTLSDNADNYDYFDFHCKRSTHIYTVRVYKPNNNTVSLTTSFCDGTYIYVYTKILNISGTQITVVRSNLGYFDNNGSHAGADDNNLIIKVVGYKII